jgi:hypothetical protein
LFLHALPLLKAIGRYGTRYETIKVTSVKEPHIRFANVLGNAAHSFRSCVAVAVRLQQRCAAGTKKLYPLTHNHRLPTF